jgi:pyruvate dehydrogenase E1 component beta subunit
MRQISFREAVREALIEEMTRDDRVFIMGEDIGPYGGVYRVTEGLWEKFGGDRVIDTPISESAVMGAAVGAALNGTRPIVEIMFADFLTLCMDHIVNGAAKVCYQYDGEMSCPLVVRAPIGITGGGAGVHHSQSCEAWFLNVPGLKVVMPSTPYDAKGLLKSAIRDDNPVLFFEHKLLYNVVGDVPEEEYTIPIGKADIKMEGSDVTIVANALMMHRALEAAKKLKDEGVSCEIVDPRSLLPLDEALIIGSVKKTGRLVIVQEAPKRYGYGAEIAAMISEKALEYLDAPIKRVANPGTPIPYTANLEQAVIPKIGDIINAVKEIVT